MAWMLPFQAHLETTYQFSYAFEASLPGWCDSFRGSTLQVQDVGLIFLSSMATSIAREGVANGIPTSDILGTTLVTITISTLLVGLLIILVGKLNSLDDLEWLRFSCLWRSQHRVKFIVSMWYCQARRALSIICVWRPKQCNFYGVLLQIFANVVNIWFTECSLCRPF